MKIPFCFSSIPFFCVSSIHPFHFVCCWVWTITDEWPLSSISLVGPVSNTSKSDTSNHSFLKETIQRIPCHFSLQVYFYFHISILAYFLNSSVCVWSWLCPHRWNLVRSILLNETTVNDELGYVRFTQEPIGELVWVLGLLYCFNPQTAGYFFNV